MEEYYFKIRKKLEEVCPDFIKQKIGEIIRSKFGKRIINAAFWSMFGAVFQNFLLLISGFFCMRILGKGGYGRLGIVRSTIQIFILFGSVGLGSTAAKYIAEFRDKDEKKLISFFSTIKTTSIATGLIATFIIIVLGERIAIYLEDITLTNSIRIGALLLFFSIFNSIQSGFLSGMEDFKGIAIATIIGGSVEFLAIIIGSYFWSVNGALVGYGIGFVALSSVNEYFIRKNRLLRINLSSITTKTVKTIVIFSLPLLGSSLMVGPIIWYVQTMLVKKCGFDELAIYTAADQWRMVLLFIPSALSRIILPMLSNTLSKNEKNDYITLLMINVKINIVTTLVLFVLFLVALPIIVYCYGLTINVYPVFVMLAGSSLFSCLASVIGQAIISRSKTWIGLLFNMGWGIMIISFSSVFLSLGLKASAIALATLISYLLHTTFQSLYFATLVKNKNNIQHC